MNLKLIESFVELIELGAFANKEDIVKGLNSAIKVTKEQAELTDEEIVNLINKHIDYVPDEDNGMKVIGVMDFARAILKKAQDD